MCDVDVCNIEVQRLEQKVKHLTESQQNSDARQAKLKDENGQFVERSVLAFYHYGYIHHSYLTLRFI